MKNAHGRVFCKRRRLFYALLKQITFAIDVLKVYPIDVGLYGIGTIAKKVKLLH